MATENEIIKIENEVKRYKRLRNFILSKEVNSNYTSIISLKEKVNPILTILEKVFPDKWDIQFGYKKVNLIIHFPEITITNEQKSSHTITDLFVKFTYDMKLRLKYIQGIRSSANIAEISNRYGHSHLRKLDYLDNLIFDSFCFGIGPLGQSVSISGSKFDIAAFEMMLYQLQDYLLWESLSGIPHIKMSTLGTQEENNLSKLSILTLDSHYTIYKYHLRTKNRIKNYKEIIKLLSNLDYSLKTNKDGTVFIEVINNDKLELFLVEVDKTINILNYVGFSERGKYFNINLVIFQDNNFEQLEAKKVLEFKEEDIYFKVTNINYEEIKKKIKKRIHPQIREYFAYRISTEITNSYFTSLQLKRESESKHSPESVESDSLSV